MQLGDSVFYLSTNGFATRFAKSLSHLRFVFENFLKIPGWGCAINASQVEVKFAAAVEKKSAEEATNYSLESYTGSITPKLVDNTTVVLTLEPDKVASLQQESKTLTVANVKSAADESKKVETFSGKVTFLDLTLPQAVEAKLIGPGKVQVYFSEPVYTDSGVGFLIDGGQYSVTVDSVVEPATKSVILSTGALSQGTHTVTVNPDGDKAVKDGAGLFVAKTDIQFNVTADVTAPALVSATASSQNTVVLTFDEPIQGIAAGAVYHTAKIAEYSNSAAAEPVPGSDKKQWKVTFANPLPTGTLTINVDKEAVEDNFGNKNANVLSATVSVSSDTVKPTVTELKVVSASRLTIAFSEDVTGADVKANYKITDRAGKAVGFNVIYNATDKKATIDFTSTLKEGETYTVEVTGIKDKAVVPNEIDKYTTSFTVADKTPPSVDGGLYDVTNRKITIFFSEAMNGTELLDKSKYTLVTNTGKQVALPSTATVAVGPNNSSVNITLPTVVKDNEGNNIINDINKVIVGQLSDLSGNKTNVFTEVEVSTEAGTIGASDVAEDSAVTVDTRTVKFFIKKPLKTIVAADFKVNNKDVEFAQYVNKTVDGIYGSEITLQVKAADKWSTDETPAIATKSGTLKSVSLYGDTFAPDTTLATAADAVAPALADINDDKKVDGKDLVLVGNADGDIESIVVSFTEDLQSGTVSIEDFEVVGHTVSNTKLDSSDASKVVITLKTPADAPDNFTVRFVGAVSDLEGNTYTGNGVELANATVAKVAQDADDLSENETAVTGVAVEFADGKVTVKNNLAVDADGKVTGDAATELSDQTPGAGSDAGKSYVGYTVSAPENGELAAAIVYQGTEELGDAKDDAGTSSSKGYINFYQAVAQGYNSSDEPIAKDGNRDDISYWKPFDFETKNYTIKWVYTDGTVKFTTFTVESDFEPVTTP